MAARSVGVVQFLHPYADARSSRAQKSRFCTFSERCLAGPANSFHAAGIDNPRLELRMQSEE
jgi:hypothetical protein